MTKKQILILNIIDYLLVPFRRNLPLGKTLYKRGDDLWKKY